MPLLFGLRPLAVLNRSRRLVTLPFLNVTDNPPNNFMAKMTCQDKVLSQALRKIDAFTSALSSVMKTFIYLNSESYSRSMSSLYLSFTSDFFSAFLCNSLPSHKCHVCMQRQDESLFQVPEASTSTPFLTSLNAVAVLTGFCHAFTRHAKTNYDKHWEKLIPLLRIYHQ